MASVENKDTQENDIENKRKAITKRGLTGLQNMGNTCYMNSAIQCLSNSDWFCSYIKHGKFKQDLKENIEKRLILAEKKRLGLKPDDPIPDNKKAEMKLPNNKDINAMAEKSVAFNLFILLNEMWKEKSVLITPKGFKETIGRINDTFKGNNQNDSQEFMSFVLDKIHEETKTEVTISPQNIPDNIKNYIKVRRNFKNLIKDKSGSDPDSKAERTRLISEFKQYRKHHPVEMANVKYLSYWRNYLKKNQSIITSLYTGLFYTEKKCRECDNISIMFEPYSILSLPIPNKDSTLEECLKTYATKEVLSGANQYRCDECRKKVDAESNAYIWESPDFLIIQLKRFTNDGQRTSKNSSFVSFPVTDLKLNEIYSPYNAHEDVYDLYAVIQQMGQLSGGHYIAHAKNCINGEWYEFDDDDIMRIPPEKVKDTVVSNKSYTLFYKKRQPDASKLDIDAI
jgi:ubiquitin carboxyl-terminal hydrolase 8